MSIRSFHSVFMASVVAGAALGCYLVSLRVASERAALEQVETQIALAQRDIRVLQTEIGTRARLAQLERWNVRVLRLSAPSADQILGDKFQLARMISPERKPALEAPVVLASAPAAGERPLRPEAAPASAAQGELLHQASLKLPDPAAKLAAEKPEGKPASPSAVATKPAETTAGKAQPRLADSKRAPAQEPDAKKKAGDKSAAAAKGAMTKPVRTAKVDPLAPLPATTSTAKASRTQR